MKTKIEPFLATYTGGKFFPLGPDPERVEIQDIAHSLSQLCRFAGHTNEFWSVAAHSLIVSQEAENRAVAFFHDARKMALAGLLHDASEAYLMDIPKPIKPLLLNYDAFEENVERAIAIKFGLEFPHPDLIHEIDTQIVPHEVANFFPRGSAAWDRYGIKDQTDYRRLLPLPPKEAERLFLRRFTQLTAGPL